jgi:hypothetical protein
MFVDPNPTTSIPAPDDNSGDGTKGAADQWGLIIGIVVGVLLVIVVIVLLYVCRPSEPLTRDEECEQTTEMECLESSINSRLAHWDTAFEITIDADRSALDQTLDETSFFLMT